MEITRTVRNGQSVNMHRCELCWPLVSTIDNGFKLVALPVVHAKGCPFGKETHGKEI
jgi:hypothetical protein